MPKLTKRFIDSIPPEKKDKVFWDDELPCFGLNESEEVVCGRGQHKRLTKDLESLVKTIPYELRPASGRKPEDARHNFIWIVWDAYEVATGEVPTISYSDAYEQSSEFLLFAEECPREIGLCPPGKPQERMSQSKEVQRKAPSRAGGGLPLSLPVFKPTAWARITSA